MIKQILEDRSHLPSAVIEALGLYSRTGLVNKVYPDATTVDDPMEVMQVGAASFVHALTLKPTPGGTPT